MWGTRRRKIDKAIKKGEAFNENGREQNHQSNKDVTRRPSKKIELTAGQRPKKRKNKMMKIENFYYRCLLLAIVVVALVRYEFNFFLHDESD